MDEPWPVRSPPHRAYQSAGCMSCHTRVQRKSWVSKLRSSVPSPKFDV